MLYYIYGLVLEQEQNFIRGGGKILMGEGSGDKGGGKWGQRGREMGTNGEGSGD